MVQLDKIIDLFEGIDLNTLVISDSDSSINYHHGQPSAEYIHHTSMEELIDIFNNEHNDIFHYDTTGTLTLILKNNTEISLHQYKESMKPYVCFIKLSTDELAAGGNEIIINMAEKNHSIVKNYRWGNHNQPSQKKEHIKNNTGNFDLSDYNGYENTCNIFSDMPEVSKDITSPVIYYCINVKEPVIVNKNQRLYYKGYLPAAGQMLLMYKYKNILNYIFEKFDTDTVDFDNIKWWSSSESNSGYISIVGKFGTYIDSKTSYYQYIFPIFKKPDNN